MKLGTAATAEVRGEAFDRAHARIGGHTARDLLERAFRHAALPRNLRPLALPLLKLLHHKLMLTHGCDTEPIFGF